MSASNKDSSFRGAMIVAIPTIVLQLVLWFLNQNAAVMERELAQKRDVLNRVATSLSKYRYLRHSKITIDHEFRIAAGRAKMSADEVGNLKRKISLRLPSEAQNAEKATEILPLLEADLFIAKAVYGKEIKNRVDKVLSMLRRKEEDTEKLFLESKPLLIDGRYSYDLFIKFIDHKYDEEVDGLLESMVIEINRVDTCCGRLKRVW